MIKKFSPSSHSDGFGGADTSVLQAAPNLPTEFYSILESGPPHVPGFLVGSVPSWEGPGEQLCEDFV